MSPATAEPIAEQPATSNPYRFTRTRTQPAAPVSPAASAAPGATEIPDAVRQDAPPSDAPHDSVQPPASTPVPAEPPVASSDSHEVIVDEDGFARRTASDVPIRPLRRDRRAWQDHEGRAGRDAIAPHVPGGAGSGDSYRGRGPAQRPGAPGRNTPQRNTPPPAPQPQQPRQPAARGPYSPGGRRQGHDNNTPPPPYMPDQSPSGSNGVPGGPAQPYGAYGGYDGYSNPAGGPNEPQQPQGGRPLRGRPGYNAPHGGYGDRYNDRYSDRPQRGQPPTPPGRGVPGRPDMYRDPGQRDGRGVPPARVPHDRRGHLVPTTGRGAYGSRYQRGRQEGPGYPAAPYANMPGADHNDGQYPQGTRAGGPAVAVRTVDVTGILWLNGGAGIGPTDVLDGRTLQPIARMNYEDIRRYGLRSGDLIVGEAEERGARRQVVSLSRVNGMRPDDLHDRASFESLTASFPDRRIRLEQGPQPVSARIIDLFAPLGFGSRALVVAPPKTGKTTLIREAAEAVLQGYPDAVVMAVLVGERPEEVTDLRARLEPRGGLVYAASFDEDTQRHAWLVQVAVERAKRVAELGKDAFMVLDSLTRLARAENLASRGQGRTLSGGIDAQALDTGRRAFGAARNLEEGGSITILATCLVETGSRQDDVVYEEFKGTGNMELHLSRDLAQRRLFPAVDAVKSGTRREEMLLTPEELRAATILRRRLADLPTGAATQQLLSVMERTPSNAALIQAIDASGLTSSAR
jgi:transcription termination factor Rho